MILAVDASVNGWLRAGPVLFDTEAIVCISPQISGEKGPVTWYELFLQGGTYLGIRPDIFQQIAPHLNAQWRARDDTSRG
jgi:hypothetical protein